MTETMYKLLKDFEDPSGKVYAGVRKTEAQWLCRFALMNPGDCKKRKDWFEEIESPTFNMDDVIGFSSYCVTKFKNYTHDPGIDFYRAYGEYFGKKL